MRIEPNVSAAQYCESCGRKAAGDARFCGGCGRSFVPGVAAAGAGERDDDDPRGGPDDAAPPAAAREASVIELRSVAVRGLGELLLCVLTVGLVYLWLLLLRSTVRYRITTQRLVVRTGLASVTDRTVELFRVRDLEVRQPWFLRMRGAGTLVVRSQDVGEPVIELTTIPGVHAVHEKLRALVNAERRRMHVRVFEEE